VSRENGRRSTIDPVPAAYDEAMLSPSVVLAFAALPAPDASVRDSFEAPQQAVSADSAPERRPSVLLIVVDDQGYVDLGCVEGSEAETPSIDRLAAEGVRFRQAYVAAPICSPSRVAILTGRYPERFGYFRNTQSEPGLPLEERTLADWLGGAGYATGAVGKWHLGSEPDRHPMRRGFESFYGFLGPWHSHYPPSESGFPNSVEKDGERQRSRGYLNHQFTEEALAFLEAHAEEEFFLYLSYGLLHTPLESPPGWHADRGDDRRTYLGMLQSLDRSIERVLGALDRLDRARDTLVVYLSDNGGGDGNGARNGGLRGYKLTLFEGGIRVPMLVRWPDVLPAGVVVDEPVLAMDAFATAVAAAGVDLPAGHAIDGRDLVPLVRGEVEGSFHPGLFWQIDNDRWAARVGDWKLVEESGERGLFNVAEDPTESLDRLEEEPALAADLERAFAEWAKGMETPPENPAPKKRRRR